MSAILVALVLASAPPDRVCVKLISDPPQTQCSWTECDTSTPPVCRRVMEVERSWCDCGKESRRTECDADGKNCRTWTWKREGRS